MTATQTCWPIRAARCWWPKTPANLPRTSTLYLNMLNMQLTYDALRIIGFDMPSMEAMGGEMNFMRDLAHAGKIAQGRFVARKKA